MACWSAGQSISMSVGTSCAVVSEQTNAKLQITRVYFS